MRVLIISNLFPPGSIDFYELGALDVSRGLHQSGHDVHVLTSDYFVDDMGGDIGFPVMRVLDCVEPNRNEVTEIDRIRRGMFVSPNNLRRIGSELMAFRPDAVLIFNCVGIGTIGLIQFLTGLRIRPVLFLMDNVFQGLPPPDQRRESGDRVFGGLAFLDQVSCIAVSRKLLAEVEATLHRALPDAVVVPGWRDPLVDHAVLKRPAAGGDASMRFVFMSRVNGAQGIDIVLSAAWQLRQSGVANFIVDVFGAGETAALQQTIVALGLSGCVRWRGAPPRVEMIPRLAEYDALLFPVQAREPFGFVVPDAAAAGCIPIMTDGIGSAEWFRDGIDCRKIKNDVTDLASAMLHVSRMSPRDREAMRSRCRETGLRQFGFDDVPRNVETLLHRAAVDPGVFEPAAVRGAEAAMTLLDEMWAPAA